MNVKNINFMVQAIETGQGDTLFYNRHTKMWFLSSINAIQKAVNAFMEKIMEFREAFFVQDLYEMLNLPYDRLPLECIEEDLDPIKYASVEFCIPLDEFSELNPYIIVEFIILRYKC